MALILANSSLLELKFMLVFDGKFKGYFGPFTSKMSKKGREKFGHYTSAKKSCLAIGE